MATPEHDDPAIDWPDDELPTTVDLLPDDLADLEQTPTPTWAPSSPIDYERGRRAGTRDERERVLEAVGAILGARAYVDPREVALFLDLVREKLRQPVRATAPRTP